MKKILVLSVALVAVIAMMGVGTWAYFNDVATVEDNTITAGTLELDVNNGSGGSPVAISIGGTRTDGNGTGLQPGDIDTQESDWTIENTGSLDGILAIKIPATSFRDLENIASSLETDTAVGDDASVPGTSTADGTTSTLIDTALTGADDAYNGMTLYITSGTNIGESRTITDYDATSYTVTVSPAFDSAIASGVTYSIDEDGELGDMVQVAIWFDQGTSNTWDASDYALLSTKTVTEDANADGILTYTEDDGTGAASVEGVPDAAFDTLTDYLGVEWDDVGDIEAGSEMTLDLMVSYNFPDAGGTDIFTLNPDNIAQSDSCEFDVNFALIQNNATP